ncbi:MAG: ERF family protein [Anaerolineae bacterium]|nr:ERF family protein [Anaerolineae bacterium]
MEHSESIANLATALSNFQTNVPSVPVDATNKFLGNRYASLGAMIETARPVLAENGLSVSQIVVSYDGQIGVETVLMHNSGEWISNTAILPAGEEKGKSGAQVAGSTITYLRRYSYAAILGLYADEDTDGNAPQQNSKQGSPKPPPAQRPARQEQTAGAEEGTVTHIPGSARLCDLDGAQLYAIQKGGPDKFSLHPKHFENRWKKRFSVRSLKDIQATLDEFMAKMAEEDLLDEAFPRDEHGNPVEDVA